MRREEEQTFRARNHPKKWVEFSALEFITLYIHNNICYNSIVSIGYRFASSPFTRSARAYHQLSVVLYSLFHVYMWEFRFRSGMRRCREHSIYHSAHCTKFFLVHISTCSRFLFLFPCENQPQLYQFLLFFQYMGTKSCTLTMILHNHISTSPDAW